MTHTIIIPGNSIPKARHRHVKRGNFVTTFDPQASIVKSVKIMLLSILPKENTYPLKNSLKITFSFEIQIAASMSQKQKNQLLWKKNASTKPDIDNLVKFYLDVGNGILWEDDRQISELTANKTYSENPHTTIEITDISMNIDQEASDILTVFSPDDYSDIVSTMFRFESAGFDENAAAKISIIADRYSKALSQIAKKHPNYWQRFQEKNGKVSNPSPL